MFDLRHFFSFNLYIRNNSNSKQILPLLISENDIKVFYLSPSKSYNRQGSKPDLNSKFWTST